ncbi:MAG: PadR family transcriptional regulator [Streptosporangiales bacterium]|nr:PadR family transcriptional regulator [Streptosporangiales bacterium]
MAAHAMPWPPFGGGGEHHRWDRWLSMAAGRGRGRPGGGRGPGPYGFRGGPGGRGAFGPPFGPPFGDPSGHRHFWGGPRARRGDVRAAVLALLAEEPRNGYQIIKEISQRSGGVWRPSAGSVYPTLQHLEDMGLIRAVESGAQRLFELTEKGRKYVDTHADELAAPWEAVSEGVGEEAMELRELLGQVTMAAMTVLRAGSPAQAAEVRRILDGTRRSLYRILAEDDADDADDAEDAGAADPAADPEEYEE